MTLRPLPNEFAETLGHYVYVYVDPRNKKPFYIGKGKDNRALEHLLAKDDPNREKAKKLKEIDDAGKDPDIYLLRYGLTDADARMVEAATIDLIGLDELTNKMRGSGKGAGPLQWRDLNEVMNAESVQIAQDHPAILININRSYKTGISKEELYEVTRGIWAANINRARQVKYAMSVFQGVVKAVYEPQKWAEAGTWADEYKTRPREDIDPAYNSHWNGRIEFKGDCAPSEIRKKYVGKLVGKHRQNPIRYED